MNKAEIENLPMLEILEMSRAIAIQQGDDHILEACDEVEETLHRFEHLYLRVPAHVR